MNSLVPNWFVSVEFQARSRTRGPVGLGPHAVAPVVSRDEVAAGVAHDGHPEGADLLQDVAAEAIGVGELGARLVDAAVDRPAQVLEERAEEPAVEGGDGARGIHDHPGAGRSRLRLRGAGEPRVGAQGHGRGRGSAEEGPAGQKGHGHLFGILKRGEHRTRRPVLPQGDGPTRYPRPMRRRHLLGLEERQPPSADHWIRVHRTAMACRFEIALSGEDARHLGAAREALEEADRVEDAPHGVSRDERGVASQCPRRGGGRGGQRRALRVAGASRGSSCRHGGCLRSHLDPPASGLGLSAEGGSKTRRRDPRGHPGARRHGARAARRGASHRAVRSPGHAGQLRQPGQGLRPRPNGAWLAARAACRRRCSPPEAAAWWPSEGATRASRWTFARSGPRALASLACASGTRPRPRAARVSSSSRWTGNAMAMSSIPGRAGRPRAS